MITSRYAVALYNIAKKRAIVHELSKDLDVLNSLLEEEKFRILIESPTLSHIQKKSIFSKIDFSTDLINDFSLYLLSKGHFYHFPRIVHIFHKILRKEENILRVRVYSSKAFTEKVRTILLKLLEEKLKNKIELKEFVDKSLLGGIKLEFKDKVIDATFKNYLDNMKKSSML